jgi:hypothetical protein
VQLRFVDVARVGDDLRVIARPAWPSASSGGRGSGFAGPLAASP